MSVANRKGEFRFGLSKRRNSCLSKWTTDNVRRGIVVRLKWECFTATCNRIFTSLIFKAENGIAPALFNKY